jgi:hypothetical protein
MERAGELRAQFRFDAEGYLCLRDGSRLEPQQLAQLDPAVQLVARARMALKDVDVLPGDGMKRQATHVQLSTQRNLWEKLTTWSARIKATRIYTLDGGWREIKTDGGMVKIATRAAIDHEGHVLGGRICEEDVSEDNYIAELAAQLGRELVPHSQLDDLILLIHQGLKGWEAEDGATGSAAQRQSLRNRIQRGMTEAWETELLRAGAAGAVRISGSGADASGRWRLALTEMVLSGCQLQKLGKEHCAEMRKAFWVRLGDLRLLGKIFAAWSRALLHITVRRAVALRELRFAREFVTRVTTGERRRLRKEVETRLAAVDEEMASNAPRLAPKPCMAMAQGRNPVNTLSIQDPPRWPPRTSRSERISTT